MIDFLKKIAYWFWFDVLIMSLLLMWLTPWGSFDMTNAGFYLSILTAVLSLRTTRFLLKKYQKGYMSKTKSS